MEKEINLYEYWQLLKQARRMIGAVVGVATTLAVLISLLLPKTYVASVSMIPLGDSKPGGIAAFASQMGLGGFLGGGSSSTSKLKAVMKSNSLGKRVVLNPEVASILYPDLSEKKMKHFLADPSEDELQSAVGQLFGRISISQDMESQLMSVSATTDSAVSAAKLANAYINGLEKYINETTLTASKKNRIFIGKQLEAQRVRVLESGKELADFYQTNRVSNVNSTLDVNVAVVDDGSFSGDPESQKALVKENETPERDGAEVQGVPGVSDAFAGGQSQREALEKKIEAVSQKIHEARTVKNVPQQVYLQYLTLQRELLGQINSLLSQQYEMSKIDETKEEVSFQVIDWAFPPRFRATPQRKKIVMTAFFISLIGSVLFVLLKDFFSKAVVLRPLSGVR